MPEVNTREVPKWMEPDDIAEVVAGFGASAKLAAEARCDGVELNAGQHSLVRQFLSGLTNHRGDEWGTDRTRFAREVLGTVRDAVGPDIQLMIEGHRRFSVAEAIKIGHELVQYDPTWFEEPTDHAKIDATAQVAATLPIPVSAGESFTSTHQFAELLAHNTVHILQPDPSNLGGILKTRMVCGMVDAWYGVVAPHQAQGPISTAVCVQIDACTPNLLVQELFDASQ